MVDDEEVENSREEAAKEAQFWQSEGHALLGQHVARYFGPADHSRKASGKRKAYLAVITKWLNETQEAFCEPLFHILHDDGDEEDLDEQEVRKAHALYARQLPEQRKRHEQVRKNELPFIYRTIIIANPPSINIFIRRRAHLLQGGQP